ncbi:MAG: tRNA guanosine(34) transglycosylase Tgt [Verrucomicrobiota bacterium]
MDRFSFKIVSNDRTTAARVGQLVTPHGAIETPNFIFCATKAAIKGVPIDQVREAGADIILSNTYHLLLQPGPELVARHGGLHQMTGWNGPMLTDSGGFQIFSIGHGWIADEIKGRRKIGAEGPGVKISEEGARFRSYVDGREILLTPESSIQTQRQLGADFILVLDECTPFHVDREYTSRSMEMSHRWAVRSRAEFDRNNDETQALYGIVQGGVYEDLRRESAEFVAHQPFFGQAIGGSLGSDKSQMVEVAGWARKHLRDDRPTHLLGIGGLTDLWEGAALGIDTFDCVHPTRLARHGGALCVPWENEGREHLNLKNSRFREDLRPLDERLPPSASRNFSRAYIHHLLKAGESLGGQLLAIHNIAFMSWMAGEIRRSIREGRFKSEMKRWTTHQ